MEQPQLSWIANFIWGIADDVLRDLYVRGKYRDVILPMVVLRRLERVAPRPFELTPNVRFPLRHLPEALPAHDERRVTPRTQGARGVALLEPTRLPGTGRLTIQMTRISPWASGGRNTRHAVPCVR